jgi:hypothetical protein
MKAWLPCPITSPLAWSRADRSAATDVAFGEAMPANVCPAVRPRLLALALAPCVAVHWRLLDELCKCLFNWGVAILGPVGGPLPLRSASAPSTAGPLYVPAKERRNGCATACPLGGGHS